ncbi:hypothetical protein LCGC14_2576420, partial [marine sediment metagenome]
MVKEEIVYSSASLSYTIFLYSVFILIESQETVNINIIEDIGRGSRMINFSSLNELREKIKEKNNSIASIRVNWINKNTYFYDQILKSLKYIVPDKSRILHIKCSTGYILSHLNPEFGIGVDDSDKQIEIARNN